MRSNIRKWLGLEFGELLETSDGQDLRVDCPFCPKKDDGKHLYVSLVQPIAHCFRCHWKGTHYDLVREVSGVETAAEVYTILTARRSSAAGFKTAVDRLRDKGRATAVGLPPRLKSDLDLPPWFKTFRELRSLDWYTRPILEYAMSRFTPEEVIRFNIGYCADPTNDLTMYRVIIPIERGYWQARTIFPDYEPKYVNPEWPIEDRVFNFPALGRARTLYVAEGVISALALGEDAIATLGMEITDGQLDRICRARASRVVLTVEDGLHWADVVGDVAKRINRQGKAVTIRTYADGDPADHGEFSEMPYTLRDIVESRLFPA